MSHKRNLVTLLLFVLMIASEVAIAQRRVFTNEDVQSTPPAPPAQSATPAPAQPASPSAQPAATASAAADATQPLDENAATRAAAEKAIQRLEEIQIAIREAGDVFFDKIREGTAPQPTINKWNQVRDNLVLASDELGLFINEARRNLPPPAAPASTPAAPAPPAQ